VSSNLDLAARVLEDAGYSSNTSEMKRPSPHTATKIVSRPVGIVGLGLMGQGIAWCGRSSTMQDQEFPLQSSA